MKNSGFIHLFCLVVSVYLYYKAPNSVSFVFNVICFALFLLQAFIVLRRDLEVDGIMTFNTIFLFSFFFVSYAFPLLIWGTPSFTREGVERFIDYNVASKCSALCTVAISSYFLSYQHSRGNSYSFGGRTSAYNLRLINIIFLTAFIALFYKTIAFIKSGGGIAVDVGQWYNIYVASLSLSLIHNCERFSINSFRQFLSGNVITLAPAIILIVIFTILGDRGLVMISSIVIVGVYNFKVRRIKARYFLVGLLLGAVLMYSLKVTRTTESSLSSGDAQAFIGTSRESLEEANFITLFADLTQIHHELYIGYDYYENRGLIEPMQFVIIPFYPFPQVPTMLSKILFGKTIEEIKPGAILNDYMAFSGHGHFGIHCVIDVFMRYGLIGVILIFYLWGFLVSSLSGSKERSVIGFAMFIILFASAIRLPRAPLLDITRIFFWVVFIVWLSGLFAGRGRGVAA